MADAVTNMIVRLLNTNDSPEDALKLVTRFLSIAVQRKLKLDPKLINEIIISTVIHNFSEFVDQLEIEDATKLFSIAITFHYYQLYDLPINPIIAEKDFIATPSYFIKPKTIQELPGDVEMSEADDVPTKPIIELSSSELKVAHPWLYMFKVRNLDFLFSKVFVIPQSSLLVPSSPTKETRQSKMKGIPKKFTESVFDPVLNTCSEKKRK
nr:uncharacterized protein LOC109166788 [Ipomoea batatas]